MSGTYEFDYEQYECATASEFFEKLRPSKWAENNEWNIQWLFRGQGNSDWKLKPSAFRWNLINEPTDKVSKLLNKFIEVNQADIDEIIENVLLKISNDFFAPVDIRTWSKSSVRNQRFQLLIHLANAEHKLLSEFSILLDQLGHPSDDYMLRSPSLGEKHGIENYSQHLLSGDRFDTSERWLSHTIAIAQHHGIPTRLLDWTKNPLIAASFAIEGINDDATHISVFALRVIKVRSPIRIQVVELPTQVSKYIHAQQGVFTIDRIAENHFLDFGDFPSLEQNTRSLDRGTIIKNNYEMKELLLPVSEASELMRLLWLENVTRAHLMPTLDNIVVALNSKWSTL